jgi:Flp pilus assembly protein TadD
MPVRFCPQCGVKAAPHAKFCSDCGAALVGDAPPPGGRWGITTAGSIVLVGFLAAGLTVWTLILSPSRPRPGPGGPAATDQGGERTAAGQKATIPPEVKTFMADLAARAKAKPDDLDTWLKLAQVDARASQIDPSYQTEALTAYEHVLGLDPKNADALRGVANVHYDREDHQNAIPAYERYLEIRPNDASARTDLGTMYLYSGQPARAVSTYQEVIRQNPSFLQAHYNLAVTYHGQGNDAGALAELDTARRLATEDGVRKQIDDMIASLKGKAPAPEAAAETAPAATAPPDGNRSPFQGAVEEAFRASPIMGPRVVRFEWTAPGTGRVFVREFPMEAMPEAVRDKFTGRLQDQLRTAREAHPVDGAVRMEIADAGSGKVMATLAP